MRVIYEWGALLSATLAAACLIFWGVSISGVLASPTTGFEVFLTRGDGRYVVSEHGNAWVGFNLKRAAEADRLRTRVPKEGIAEWKGPGFLVFITGQDWLVGGSMLIPMFASAIVATICFVAHRRVSRKPRAVPQESQSSESPATFKRRWSRFCIRTMLVVAGVLCVGLSLWVIRAERQRRAVAAIKEFGGDVGCFQNYNQAMGVPLALLRRWLPPVYSCNVGFVRLDNTPVTDAGLAHLERLTGLGELSLNGTQVTGTGLVYLHGMTGLQRLSLVNTYVTDAGLANLQGFTSLRIIRLGGTQVTDAGLAHLQGLTGLQELNLNGTQITDAGLAHLQGLTSLQGLYLWKAQVTGAGLRHLRGLTSLQQLSLEDTQVTDAGLVHLQDMAGLQRLSLWNTQVTHAGLTQLRKALPNCFINGPP